MLEREGPEFETPWKKRLTAAPIGEVVWVRPWDCSTGWTGAGLKSVINLRGESLGVIFRVARGFEGELMESLRVILGSVSERDRE